jgi:hypothetical protein
MNSIDDAARNLRVQEARSRLLQTAPEPYDSLEELVRRSQRAHDKLVRNDQSPDATEVTIRLHGAGVNGHKVPVAHASPLLDELQRTVKWIGASLRKDLDANKILGSRRDRDRRGLAEATRLFLQPQLGAGSLVFHLVAEAPSDGEGTLGVDSSESLLDLALQRLIGVVTDAEADQAEDLGQLADAVRRIGPQAASAINKVADTVVKHDIDIDLTWTSGLGRRRTAKLRRRGALAIKDAVVRNRERTEVIPLTGLLETVSVGKDPVRVETPDGTTYKMAVDAELGKQLGPLLHRTVDVRAEETITWLASGKVRRRYVLLSAEAVDEFPT